jgi:hypothetical protein
MSPLGIFTQIYSEMIMYFIRMDNQYDDMLDQILKHIRVNPDDINEHLTAEVSSTVFYGIMVLLARKILTNSEKREFLSATRRMIKQRLISEFSHQSKKDDLVVDQEDFILSLNKILDDMEKRLYNLLSTH